MTNAPETPIADAKDWTWVTRGPCAECGFDPAAVTPANLPELILGAAEPFGTAIERSGAGERRSPGVWSPIEYGRHVADVLEVMTRRLGLIIDAEGEGVDFDDWDQDAAAVEGEYWKANGHATAILLRERAEGAAKAWSEPEGAQWEWVGRRSDGAEFTALSLGRYLAHELRHHLHDIDG